MIRLFELQPGGMRITFLDSETDKEEASAVVNHIQHLVTHQGHSWGDMAVLYRANMQARDLTNRQTLLYFCSAVHSIASTS